MGQWPVQQRQKNRSVARRRAVSDAGANHTYENRALPVSAAARRSVVDSLAQGETVELSGEGVLTLQPGQSGPPVGPGRVRFRLVYAPEEGTDRPTRTIALSLEATDDGGRGILGYSPAAGGPVPIPRYDFRGIAASDGEDVPTRMEPVLVDHRFSASMHGALYEDFTFKVVSGEGLGSKVTRARAVVPNLPAPSVETETSGLKVRLEPIHPDADGAIRDPANANKALPTCLLHLERAEGAEAPDIAEAIEVFGWLLSFYAGGPVHPNAWEGETEAGPLWCLRASDVRRLPAEPLQTCLPRNALGPFLGRAWEAWTGLDDRHKGRLRGVVNLYAQILSSTYPIQQIALTAMYLERFRELVLGNETVLEKIHAKEKGFDEDKVAKMLRNVLNDLVGFVAGLDHDDRGKLRRAIDGIGGGPVSGLFRPSFQRSLMELYGRARLPLPDRDELKTFIDERNAVVHGYWNPSPENALPSHRLAEYGTNLLEKLILRFFRYDGPYYDRTIGEATPFEHKDPGW